MAAAEILKERGAYKIYVMATHGLLSSDAPRLIEDSPIDEVSHSIMHYLSIKIIFLVKYFVLYNFYFLIPYPNWWMRTFLIF